MQFGIEGFEEKQCNQSVQLSGSTGEARETKKREA